MNPTATFRMRIFAAILLSVMLAAVFVPAWPAFAQDSGKTVRVGWYESSFNQTDSFGRRSGYGYEYQQRIALYTGWNYEYVEGSWSDLMAMLEAGEIDLLSDVSFTEERAKRILYSSEGMGLEEYHAFISSENIEISPDDFSTMDGKRVGVNQNSLQEQLFKDWAKDHDIRPDIVELSVPLSEQVQMLEQGELDVLVTLDSAAKNYGIVSVCKTGSSDIYFGISKNRKDLKNELDVAMNRILEENGHYSHQLAEKYNSGQTTDGFLTVEERTWIEDHGVIRVGYLENFLPYCETDGSTGSVSGALHDFLTMAATAEKNARMVFETRAFDMEEDGLKALEKGEIDCLFPVNLSDYDGEQRGMITTDPLIRTEMYAAVRTEDHQGVSNDRKMIAAVREGNQNYETFLMDFFPKWKMEYCGSSREGCRAVANGKADCMLVSNYRLSRFDNLCQRYDLSTLSTGEIMDLSFAVERENDKLFSILNKVSRLIPESMINASLTNYAFGEERITFGDYLRDNLIYAVAVAAILAAVILLLLLINVRTGIQSREGRRLISQTERDQLTGLYNRNYFFVYANRLFHEKKETYMDAVVINIDRFHMVNALNGREFGDEVLRTLGREVELSVEGTDGIAGRFGDDRFDIYNPHRENYRVLLDRFQRKINDEFPQADIRIRMGVMPWQEGMEPETQFDLARSACSAVRGRYKTHLMVYDEEMHRQEQLNERLRNDLSRALEEHELEVYYQPKYDIRSEEPKLSSAEALIRWNHPELGMVMPGIFIPLFEQSGQISELDRYVWTEAARQIAAWKEEYGKVLPVSVNLSRVDVFDPELPYILDKIVLEYGLNRRDLKLEITESAYTDQAEFLISVIGKLRERGYEIEMDDFGSGYSSLNMLSSMPVDVLKMDGEFIRHMEEDERNIRLVGLILDIAENLKVPVIAEGVETEDQIKILKDLGCTIVQGYYFSRPLPAEKFEAQILTASL